MRTARLKLIVPVGLVVFAARFCSGNALTNQSTNIETICECLNPLNNEDIHAEWAKVEQALSENGITNIGSFGLFLEAFFVPADQARKARQVISQMIKDGKVDAQKLRLRVVDESGKTIETEEHRGPESPDSRTTP